MLLNIIVIYELYSSFSDHLGYSYFFNQFEIIRACGQNGIFVCKSGSLDDN